jgi:hypothetical protein
VIAVDARAPVMTACRVDQAVARRIDLLAQKVRTELGESPNTIPRAVVLRALLILGLDLAEPRGLAVPALGKFSLRYDYRVSAADQERLDRFRSARWLVTLRPMPQQLQGALVQLALEHAEARASFAREVLSSRLPRMTDPA